VTINKRQTILILSIATTIILSGIAITANTLNMATAQTAIPTSPCPPADQVQHWDKIIFRLGTGERFEAKRSTFEGIPIGFVSATLDLKVPDQPGVIVNLNQEIADELATQFSLTPEQKSFWQNRINVIDDKYETVTCGSAGPQGPQGPPGTSPRSVNCPTGQFVTGFDANGALICGSKSGPSPAESACAGKTSGDVCSFALDAKTFSGTCQALPNSLLVCTPLPTLTLNPTISQNPVTAGTLVTLNANPTGGTPPISYNWSVTSHPAGSAAILSSTTTLNPTFTPDLAGNYQFSVSATDSNGINAAPMFLTLTVNGA